ncbi:MAG TPA: tRNA preQ1(34) S-adenosylmethionine ribosyltransferase-isomerase QueA [Anaerohalosphaeraceae bacterium]|nr:tRNA preQ1(34) S-adenosylmethionine ribosyltransferase-isomerase QueA [Anaerohalosphaeraceae bacterium]
MIPSWPMRTDLFDYELPEELIAQKPSERRPHSRLLVLHRIDGRLEDRLFADLTEYLRPGDCLVLNDTKVLPARFFCRKATGGLLEGLFLEETADGCWKVLLKNARKIKTGARLTFLDRRGRLWQDFEVLEKLSEGQWVIRPALRAGAEAVLETIGTAPLPPYIKRPALPEHPEEDLARYQTVFARRPGAVAAPTAGLHFDKALLDRLEGMGIRTAYLTLHVGLGTFRPVQTETLEAHTMHSERYEISPQAAEIINTAAKTGGRIIAVGTTSVRTLETVAENRQVRAASGRTDLFITPGYSFKIVDAMITNFHLPRSTLLALVAAFAGLEKIKAAYRHAVQERYRFYSYGDAMLIL